MMAHSYKKGQKVRVENQLTEIISILTDTDGGYMVWPKIRCGSGRGLCEVGFWNEDVMEPVSEELYRRSTFSSS